MDNLNRKSIEIEEHEDGSYELTVSLPGLEQLASLGFGVCDRIRFPCVYPDSLDADELQIRIL